MKTDGTSNTEYSATSHPHTNEPAAGSGDSGWSWLYNTGGAAALFAVTMIPIQLIVFVVWGQPETATGWFNLFEDSKLAGLLAFELLLVVSTALGIVTTLALYVALRRVSESVMAIALAIGFLQAISFIVARPAFEMLFYDAARSSIWYEFGFLLGAGSPVLGASGRGTQRGG